MVLERAEQLYTELGDLGGAARCLGNRGAILRANSTRHDEALHCMTKALDLFARLGDEAGIGTAWYNIGWIRTQLHDYEGAVTAYEQAVQTLSQLGDVGTGVCEADLAGVLRLMGQRDKAAGLLTNCLERHRRIGDHQGEAAAIKELAALHADTGDWAASLDYATQAADLYEHRDRAVFARACLTMVRAHLGLGQLDHARRIWTDVHDIAEVQGLTIEPDLLHQLSNTQETGV
jgi:tetratricopeptide (TPR) repeat protein